MQEVVLHKEVLLKILDKFVDVCKKYDLKYYLAGGSVLGAVRHKGMIPWDDDIDVYMLRADYEKLQLLPDDVWGEDMRLASWRKVKNYRYDFLKVELINTTVIERFYPDYVGGVFMDIFPLDVVPEDNAMRLPQLNKVKNLMREYIESYILRDSECTSIWHLLRIKFLRWKNRDGEILDKWEKIVSAFPSSDKLIVDYHSPWIDRPMPIDYIGEGIEMEFEGKMYIVPTNWDAYLTHVYGNYMQLPPEEKRVGHAFEFVNYERRISEAEIREFLQAKHKQLKYKFSIKREVKRLIKGK